MRVGDKVSELGVLLSDAGGFSLRRDLGGRYLLDLPRAPVDRVGQRVLVIGTYVGGDLVHVAQIANA